MVFFQLSFCKNLCWGWPVGGGSDRDPVLQQFAALSPRRCANHTIPCSVTLGWWAGSEEGPGLGQGGAGREAAILVGVLRVGLPEKVALSRGWAEGRK